MSTRTGRGNDALSTAGTEDTVPEIPLDVKVVKKKEEMTKEWHYLRKDPEEILKTPLPLVATFHRQLEIFRAANIHCIMVVENVKNRVLKIRRSGSLRVAVVSTKSLFLCDLAGPIKRTINLMSISQVHTQKVPRKDQMIQYVLIKVPTEHDVLLSLIPDPRNSYSPPFLETLAAAWTHERFRTTKAVQALPVFIVQKDEDIQTSARLNDTSRYAGDTRCKGCEAKDIELTANKEQLAQLMVQLDIMNSKARRADDLDEQNDKLRETTKKSVAARNMYRRKVKKLLACINELEQELDEWKEFCEQLVVQAQFRNVPGDLQNLCHPQRVALLEWKLEQAEAKARLGELAFQHATSLKETESLPDDESRHAESRGDAVSSSSQSETEEHQSTTRLSKLSLKMLESLGPTNE